MNLNEFNADIAAIREGEAAKSRIAVRINEIRDRARVVREIYDIPGRLPTDRNALLFINWLNLKNHHSIFTVPGSVDTIEIFDSYITATFETQWRGESDYEYLHIPYAWIFAENIDKILHEEFNKLILEFQAYEVNHNKEQTERERAQYEALRAKFEPTL